jgi:hypothetical protein
MAMEDWQSPSAYQFAAHLDEGGLAWEFLRRNRRYRDEHAALVGAADLVTETAARRWGLRFRGRSRGPCRQSHSRLGS